MFAPYVTGRLTVAGAYWCDAEVQRTPDISVSGLWPTFSFQLYCPDPYWHSVKELTVSTLSVTPTFRLPVCYDVHSYGVREQANYLRIANTGLATQDWALTLEARGPVVNPGVKDPETGEFLLLCHHPAGRRQAPAVPRERPAETGTDHRRHRLQHHVHAGREQHPVDFAPRDAGMAAHSGFRHGMAVPDPDLQHGVLHRGPGGGRQWLNGQVP